MWNKSVKHEFCITLLTKDDLEKEQLFPFVNVFHSYSASIGHSEMFSSSINIRSKRKKFF